MNTSTVILNKPWIYSVLVVYILLMVYDWVSRAVYSSWFQVSGTPGRHQWVQSRTRWPPAPKTEGWPSCLYCDMEVMFSRYTGLDIVFRTFSSTSSPGWASPVIVVGSVSPVQLSDLELSTLHFEYNETVIIKIKSESYEKNFVTDLWMDLQVMIRGNSLEEHCSLCGV